MIIKIRDLDKLRQNRVPAKRLTDAATVDDSELTLGDTCRKSG